MDAESTKHPHSARASSALLSWYDAVVMFENIYMFCLCGYLMAFYLGTCTKYYFALCFVYSLSWDWNEVFLERDRESMDNSV